MAKLHYYDYEVLEHAPSSVKSEYRSKGLDGAICGYVRKTTTIKKDDTCFFCKQLLKRI